MRGQKRQTLALAADPRLELKRPRATIVQVKVKPNSRVSLLSPAEGGAWLAQLKSPPVDGKANEELLALVARHFGCRKSDVRITSGTSGRTKWVRIEGGGPVGQNVA